MANRRVYVHVYVPRYKSVYEGKTTRKIDKHTLVDWIVSSSSASHDVASEALSVCEVVWSILVSIFEDTSCGGACRGKWDGTGNAMRSKGGEPLPGSSHSASSRHHACQPRSNITFRSNDCYISWYVVLTYRRM